MAKSGAILENILLDLGEGLSLELSHEVSGFITFIPHTPKHATRPRARVMGKIATVYNDPEYTKNKQRTTFFLQNVWGDRAPMDFPVIVIANLYVPKPKSVKRIYPEVKPDIDNMIKLLFDSITEAGILTDDCKIVDMIVRKRYAIDHKVGTDLLIIPLEGCS